MKQLRNILNQHSTGFGQEPRGMVCAYDSEIVDKRCLYTWVS